MTAPRTVSEQEQQGVTRICAQTGLMLMQHGAESALAESVARRMGLALGVDEVEIALMANGITVTTMLRGRTDTVVRRTLDRGLNMHIVTEVQRSMLLAEEGALDLAGVTRALDSIRPFRYNRWLVSFMVGLSCAAFARLVMLSHGDAWDWRTCLLTFVASGVAMHVRQWLAHRHLNPMVNFAVSAFVATSISSQGAIHGWVGDPKLAIAASVLLLVPGYPLINSVSDMVKGYVNTGIARASLAVLLLLASCGGIVLAMTVWKTWIWL